MTTSNKSRYADDNEFEWVETTTLLGYPYRYRRRRLPRIPDIALNSVFYLYETNEDAESGMQTGGTGFWVGVQSQTFPERSDVYAITCKHVVKPKIPEKNSMQPRRDPAPVIRLNTVDGRFDTLPLSEDDWYSFEDMYPSEKHDLAIHERGSVNTSHQVAFILRPSLLTEAEYKARSVGAGDDVFMVGRYINHDGQQRNLPSVRFGNVSMLPEDTLWHGEEQFEEVSFIVEMRSVSGYSGSPVYLYVAVGVWGGEDGNIPSVPITPKRLLGIQWSQPPKYEYHEQVGGLVKVWSGMSNVIPAWYIDKMLDWEVFKLHREENDKEWAKTHKNRNSQVSTSAQHDEGYDKQEDFHDVLDRAIRPKQPPDPESSETSE